MTIANNNGSTTLFQDNSTAANATIVSGSGLDPGFFGGVGFAGSSTAGNATIINNKGGASIFFDNSTAGNATIVSNGGPGGFGGLSTLDAAVDFEGSSTGGNATITANVSLDMVHRNSGSGGQARFIANAGGAFDLSPLAISGTTAGSIEGAGAVRLGSKQLTVGANNLSTTVSGVIADGGRNGGTGGSLVKVGARHAHADRRQHLYRRHDGQRRADQLRDGQQLRHRQDHAERRRPAMGDRHLDRHLLRGWRRSAPAAASSTPTATTSPSPAGSAVTGGLTKQGSGMLSLNGTQHLHRPHHGHRRHAGRERQPGQHGHPGQRRHAGRQRHDRRPGLQRRHAGARQLDRHARRSAATSARTAASTRSRPTRRARATASTSAARPPSAAAPRCRCWPSPAPTAATPPTPSCAPTAACSGTYSGVSSNFAFLTPSLSYDANDVFLTLSLAAERLLLFGGRTLQPARCRPRARPDLRLGERRLRHGAERHRRASARRRARWR